MKKALSVVLLILLCLMLFGCGVYTEEGKNIAIEIGTIVVPSDWTIHKNDGLNCFYCYDELCAFQSNSLSSFADEIDPTGIVEKNSLSDEFQNLYTISSNSLSNGVIYGEAMVLVDGVEQKMRFIEFSDSENIEQLFFVSDEVSEDVFIGIAKSFESE